MKTEKEIQKEIEKLKEYKKHSDDRFDCTQKEVIQEAINALEWVLKGEE